MIDIRHLGENRIVRRPARDHGEVKNVKPDADRQGDAFESGLTYCQRFGYTLNENGTVDFKW